jgi:tetratricopeptide (TPR) repeat protein
VLCFLGLSVAPLQAQHESHEAHEVVGWVPRDILERPVSLRRDIGNLREKVTTSSREAQSFYAQGLNYLSSYVWIEAARSFHQALRLDPNLAAAYLGLSNVYVALQDIPAARSALDTAQSLSAGVSDAERERIEIQFRLVALRDVTWSSSHASCDLAFCRLPCLCHRELCIPWLADNSLFHGSLVVRGP